MEEHPDSSLMILEGMEIPDETDEYNHALYNLLLTHARYKNFIDDRNDSVISKTAEYFIKIKDTEKASRSLFMAGTIRKNSGKYGDAAVSYSKGLDMAAAGKCYMWEGQCARGLFQLYNDLLDGSAQLQYAKEAYEAFSKGGFEDWRNDAELCIAIAYNNSGIYEKADSITQSVKEKALNTSDSLLMKESLRLSGLIHYAMDKYEVSLSNYAQAFELDSNVLETSDKTNILSGSRHLDIDTLPSNLRIFVDKVKAMDDAQQSLSVLVEQGDFEAAYKNVLKYKARQDSVIKIILQNNVTGSINRYEYAIKRTEMAERRNTAIIYCLIILLILIVVGFAAMLIKRNMNKKDKATQEVVDDLSETRRNLDVQVDRNNSMSKSLSKALQERYKEIDSLCEKHFSRGKLEHSEANDRISEIVSQFNDSDFLRNVESDIDNYMDGLYSSFKNDFPQMKEDNLKLFLYYCLGFSPRTISILLDLDMDVIYNKKSRLRAKIKGSSSSRRDEYLNALKK